MRLSIQTITAFSELEIRSYWMAHIANNSLRYRINDMPQPDMGDVAGMLARTDSIHTYVKDLDPDNPRIVGECMLDQIKGNAARLHFSLLPSTTTKEKKEITHKTLDVILQSFTDPDIKTLYGITPVKNRVACLYVLGSRFTKMCVIPGGEVHHGKPCDAMVTVLTRETVKQTLWGSE